jgi:hypothetical protein
MAYEFITVMNNIERHVFYLRRNVSDSVYVSGDRD